MDDLTVEIMGDKIDVRSVKKALITHPNIKPRRIILELNGRKEKQAYNNVSEKDYTSFKEAYFKANIEQR